MVFETVLTEKRGDSGGILWVTLNRPEKLNALNMTLFDELRQVFQAARTDRSVRCVVLTGPDEGSAPGLISAVADPGTCSTHRPNPPPTSRAPACSFATNRRRISPSSGWTSRSSLR